jgi:hypothetical protein
VVKRFTPPPADAEALMTGVIGATEALSREVTSGRLDRATAIRSIGHIMLRTVSG